MFSFSDNGEMHKSRHKVNLYADVQDDYIPIRGIAGQFKALM
jgi:hypothetical protein